MSMMVEVHSGLCLLCCYCTSQISGATVGSAERRVWFALLCLFSLDVKAKLCEKVPMTTSLRQAHRRMQSHDMAEI